MQAPEGRQKSPGYRSLLLDDKTQPESARLNPGCLVALIIFVVMLLCACTGLAYWWPHQRQRGKLAAMGTNIKQLWFAISAYEQEHERPPRHFDELDLPRRETLIDLISGKEYAHSGNMSARQDVRNKIVWQPEPYRTWGWPFGEWKRLTLFADGHYEFVLEDKNE